MSIRANCITSDTYLWKMNAEYDYFFPYSHIISNVFLKIPAAQITYTHENHEVSFLTIRQWKSNWTKPSRYIPAKRNFTVTFISSSVHSTRKERQGSSQITEEWPEWSCWHDTEKKNPGMLWVKYSSGKGVVFFILGISLVGLPAGCQPQL